jgi:hypothetical protein
LVMFCGEAIQQQRGGLKMGVALWDANPAGWEFKSQLDLILCEGSQLPWWLGLRICLQSHQYWKKKKKT